MKLVSALDARLQIELTVLQPLRVRRAHLVLVKQQQSIVTASSDGRLLVLTGDVPKRPFLSVQLFAKRAFSQDCQVMAMCVSR